MNYRFWTLSSIYKNLYSVHNRDKYLPRGELICKILDEDKKNKVLIETRIYTHAVIGRALADKTDAAIGTVECVVQCRV